ncbi:hypothetical protein [Neorhizobium sp. T25_13]|uniref:hyaluronate lyase N-terminal domain-containing protein n=1 Tax=Neorhizobium sp. T25_13 TaxID=2093830 RepID=UPI000CF9AC71|nr:hypothetical protein [Neorhizobium sp. T25_13]
MATQIRHRRGTTAQHAAFTGALAEVTVDTDKKTAVVHDGVTAGGIPLARDDGKNDGAFGYLQDIKTNDYPIVVGDIGKMLVANKATAINFTLGTAAALTSKFVAGFKNIGVGVLSITPTGAELIDGVNAAITVPAGGSVILKGDGTSFRTYLSNGDVTGSAINNAPALTGANLANNDKIPVYDVSAGLLTSLLYSELLAGTFKTSRTIANAQFDSASFKLFNAAGTPRALTFNTTALTADRVVTMPDSPVDLGAMGIKTDAVVTLSGVSQDIIGIPTGVRRIFVALNKVTVSAAAQLFMQLGSSAGVVTTGYEGSAGFAGTGGAGGAALTTGHPVTYQTASMVGPYIGHLMLTRIGSTNQWLVTSVVQVISGGMVMATSLVTLPGTLDRIRFGTVANTATLGGSVEFFREMDI